jgi:hypothetical protein
MLGFFIRQAAGEDEGTLDHEAAEGVTNEDDRSIETIA